MLFETDSPELQLLLWIVLPFLGSLSVLSSEWKGLNPWEIFVATNKLGPFQGLCINPSCDTNSNPRRGKDKVIGPGELNMSVIILITPTTIY